MEIISHNHTKYDNLYEIAEQQAGYFTAAQARQAGFSQRLLTYYVAQHRFRRIRSGVYRLVQFPASPHEDLFVAWLAAGSNAVISHESALALYGLSDVLPREIHVIIPRTASRRRRGIRLHTNQLVGGDVTTYAGLTVTTVPRTIAHVAASGLGDDLIIQAIHEATARGLVSKADLLQMAAQQGGRTERLVNLAIEGGETIP